jgi:hypothetical protein
MAAELITDDEVQDLHVLPDRLGLHLTWMRWSPVTSSSTFGLGRFLELSALLAPGTGVRADEPRQGLARADSGGQAPGSQPSRWRFSTASASRPAAKTSSSVPTTVKNLARLSL